MSSANQMFTLTKQKCLRSDDLSKKGSIDEKILDLIKYINDLDYYFTTSSCSGRIIVYTNSIKNKKRDCNWIFVSHDLVDQDQNSLIRTIENDKGSAILKFEPFILHVQCSSVKVAQKLHALSIESGFKNSGITIGKSGKITLAIRSTLTLEVPLSDNGSLLVSKEYISYIIKICNEKLIENWNRTERLFMNLKKSFSENKEEKKIKHNSFKKCESLKNVDQDYTLTIENFYDGFENMLNDYN